MGSHPMTLSWVSNFLSSPLKLRCMATVQLQHNANKPQCSTSLIICGSHAFAFLPSSTLGYFRVPIHLLSLPYVLCSVLWWLGLCLGLNLAGLSGSGMHARYTHLSLPFYSSLRQIFHGANEKGSRDDGHDGFGGNACVLLRQQLLEVSSQFFICFAFLSWTFLF